MNPKSKQAMIMQIKKGISITNGYYKPTDVGGRFTYKTDGQSRFINITTPLEQALFLKTHGLIHTYTIARDGSIKMFAIILLTGTGHRGVPVQTQRKVPVQWADFTFTAGQVLDFAAVHEYNRCRAIMEADAENAAGKVINLVKNYLKAA